MSLLDRWCVDWTAVAAFIALAIWLIDSSRRRHERRATERFIAQLLVTEFAAARVDVARLRAEIAPPGTADPSQILALLDSQEARRSLADRATQLRLELPSVALDKADVFRQWTSNRMALALSVVMRLKQAGMLMADMEGAAASDNDIEVAVRHFLELIHDAEQAIQDAYSALLETGKASRFMMS